MEAKIKGLNDHFIVCGYGRVGEAIASTLKDQKTDFVIIERNLNNYTRAAQQDLLAIEDAVKTTV